MYMQNHLFSSPVYFLKKPEFLEVTRKVCTKFLEKRKEEIDLNPMYPAYMTENLHWEPEMLDFANYTAQTGWNILNEQGYNMVNFATFFSEMWCQEHHNGSAMEKHIHHNGAQIVGFYFLNVPEKSSKVVFHDPRDAKVIINMPEKDHMMATHGSNMINFEPEEGMLIFANSWLPHSFSRNESTSPMRFIHFNIGVERYQPTTCSTTNVEVI